MNIIVACCKNNGIGFKGRLPWHLPKELIYFKSITQLGKKNAIIVGKNTWQKDLYSTPLPKRHNIILSSTETKDNTGREDEFKVVKNTNEMYNYINNTTSYDNIWVLGGKNVYKEFLKDNNVKYIFKTDIHRFYNCDTFFPDMSDKYQNVYTSKLFNDRGIYFNINIYENTNYSPIHINNNYSIEDYHKVINNVWENK